MDSNAKMRETSELSIDSLNAAFGLIPAVYKLWRYLVVNMTCASGPNPIEKSNQLGLTIVHDLLFPFRG